MHRSTIAPPRIASRIHWRSSPAAQRRRVARLRRSWRLASPSAVNTSIASFSKRRSRSARSRRRFACTWDAASLAACLIVCLPITAPLSHRQRLHSPMDFQLAERSPFRRGLNDALRISCSADSTREHLNPQTSQCVRAYADVQLSLKISDSYFHALRWTTQILVRSGSDPEQS